MATYVYFPEFTPSFQQGAQAWIDGRLANGKVPPTMIPSSHSAGVEIGVLAGLTPLDTLYVNLHGRPGDPNFSATHPDGRISVYTARSLARLLHREGLPLTFRRLKLYTCGSGKATEAGAAPASLLKLEMSSLGFTQLTVYGYNSDTNSNTYMKVTDLLDVPVKGTHKPADNLLGVGSGPYRAKLVRVAF